MDSRIKIKVASDRMTAMVRIAKGEVMNEHGLRECCRRGGVISGIDDALAADLGERLAEGRFMFEGVIARGVEPVAGVDGRIEFEFPIEQLAGTKLADGRIDFHERNLLQSVDLGARLGHLIEPIEGVPGVRVDGTAIAVEAVQKVGFGKLGKGVAMIEGGVVEATREGVLVVQPHSLIDVVDEYQHRGDVDVTTGDLHVRGSIDVTGDIAESFCVAATRDVVVRGTVADARIDGGANVTVKGGAMGPLAVLSAGHDLSCRHVSCATLAAGGELTLTDHGVDSHLSGHSVSVEQGRGRIVGGEVRARQAIHLIEAGNEIGAETVLMVADTSRERRDLRALETKQRQSERRSRKRGAQAAKRGAKDKRLQVGQSAQIMKQKRELDRLESALLEAAEVTVRGAIHVGVKICFGCHERDINAVENGVRYTFDAATGKIIEESYSS